MALTWKHTTPFHLNSSKTNVCPWFHALWSFCFALCYKAKLLSLKLLAPIWLCGFILRPYCMRKDRLLALYFFLLPFTKRFPTPENYQGSLKHPVILIPIKLRAMGDKSEFT